MLYTLEQQEAMGASGSGRVQQLIKEEDASPTFFTGLESTSPNVSNAKQNGGKKMRKT